MNGALRLAPITPETYARDVLAQTADLWANGRTFETYVAQTTQIAASAYGRRSYATYGLYDGVSLLASFKRYERSVRSGKRRLRAVGIGAVFTPPAMRGRGHASAMLALLLDDARKRGTDFAYLFSDIHPQFYKAIGFAELPSRAISVRSDTLDARRIAVESIGERDWPGVRRCFDAMSAERPWSFERTPVVWDWVRMRIRHGSEHSEGAPANLLVRRGRTVVAYVLGQREPSRDCFVIDEYGHADDEAAALVPPLLRSAAGDLRRLTGWLPPQGARDALPRGSVRKRTGAVWMAAPLSIAGRTFVQAAGAPNSADGVWSTDHI